jgi:hypothetical protein
MALSPITESHRIGTTAYDLGDTQVLRLPGHQALFAPMNYLAHGWPFLDYPYFLAGTAVPDWLSVADRQVRARGKQAAPICNDDDLRVAALARGIVQHHEDDRWFHETRAFVELSLEFTSTIRRHLKPDEGSRPWFLGHILVEILLDAALLESAPARVEQYYAALSAVEPRVVEAAVNRIAPRQTDRLAGFVSLFCAERFLWDYADDDKLCTRLDQVLRRVGLPPLPPSFGELLPEMRNAVRRRSSELLCARHVNARD